jgi:hypothetical protein
MSSNIPNIAKFQKIVAHYQALVFNVYSNTDTNEGRGASILIGSFADVHDAKSFSLGKGVMGTPANVKMEQVEIIVPISNKGVGEHNLSWNWDKAEVISKLNPLHTVDPKKKREEILNKLTKEERDFLGLK